MSNAWPVVFMGTPQIAADTLQALLDGPDPVVGVVTQPGRPAGRGQKISPSSVRALAASRGIPVEAPEKIRDPEFLSKLRHWNPQVIVVVAFGRILPESILGLAPYGCVNVHYSLLPKYRGAAPAAWTIIEGDEKGGVTTMKLVKEMDAGPIYLQEELALAPDETAASLQAKLTPVGCRLITETLARLKRGTLSPRSQNPVGVSFAPVIKKADGLIDWTQSAIAIERRARGFTPWPSAYSYLHGKLIKVHRARVIDTRETGSPGDILRADDSGLWVATGAGVLGLDEVQFENKRRLGAVEFIRGARVVKGERLARSQA